MHSRPTTGTHTLKKMRKNFTKETFIALTAIAAAFVSGCSAPAEKPAEEQFTRTAQIRLYEGPAPGTENARTDLESVVMERGDSTIVNVATPTITAFIPKGENKKAAAVICPGGGYTQLSWEKEGVNLAKWLASNGVTSFVLKYRLNISEGNTGMSGNMGSVGNLAASFDAPHDTPTIVDYAADDGRAAIAYVREHAVQYGIDPDHIALIGFSAGARLTWNVEYDHDSKSRPDLIAPIYCNVPRETMPEDPVPCFIAAPVYDIYPVPTGMDLYRMWREARIPCEIHHFSGTHHGFGYKDDGQSVQIWPKLLWNFMINAKFIEGSFML